MSLILCTQAEFLSSKSCFVFSYGLMFANYMIVCVYMCVGAKPWTTGNCVIGVGTFVYSVAYTGTHVPLVNRSFARLCITFKILISMPILIVCTTSNNN